MSLVIPQRRLWLPTAPLWFAKKRWRNASDQRIRFSTGADAGKRMYSDTCCCAECDVGNVSRMKFTISGFGGDYTCTEASGDQQIYEQSNINGVYETTTFGGGEPTNCKRGQFSIGTSGSFSDPGIRVRRWSIVALDYYIDYYIWRISVRCCCCTIADPETFCADVCGTSPPWTLCIFSMHRVRALKSGGDPFATNSGSGDNTIHSNDALVCDDLSTAFSSETLDYPSAGYIDAAGSTLDYDFMCGTVCEGTPHSHATAVTAKVELFDS